MTTEPPLTDTVNAARFYNRAAFVLLFALLILRLVTAARFELAWDESYYWQWSRHLALCYYDAGPGVAFTIRAGTALFGDTPFGVRFMPVLMSVAAYGLMYLTARRWFTHRVAFWTLVLAAVAPLLAIGSVLATYDLPQIFFWAAGLYALTRAVQDKNGVLWWYVTGLCVGVGTLTKPTMIFFAPGVLLLLALVPGYRKHLASPHPYLAFVVALLCLSPIFIWNAQNDNVNWIHTLNRGNRNTNAAPGRWLGDFWGGQAIVVGPFLLLLELYAIFRALRRPTEPGNAFIVAFTVPILVLCTLISVRSKVEVNWPVAAHLTGLLAIATLLTPSFTQGKGKSWEAGIKISAAFSAIVTLILFLPNVLLLRPFGPFQANATWEKVNELYGWKTITDAAEKERAGMTAEQPNNPATVAGTGYRVCSILAFYLTGQPEVPKIQIPDTRHDQYNVWTKENSLVGKNFVVAIDGKRDEQVENLQTRFDRVSAPVIVNVTRPGFTGPVKTWYLYRCYGYRQ